LIAPASPQLSRVSYSTLLFFFLLLLPSCNKIYRNLNALDCLTFLFLEDPSNHLFLITLVFRHTPFIPSTPAFVHDQLLFFFFAILLFFFSSQAIAGYPRLRFPSRLCAPLPSAPPPPCVQVFPRECYFPSLLFCFRSEFTVFSPSSEFFVFPCQSFASVFFVVLRPPPHFSGTTLSPSSLSLSWIQVNLQFRQ